MGVGVGIFNVGFYSALEIVFVIRQLGMFVATKTKQKLMWFKSYKKKNKYWALVTCS